MQNSNETRPAALGCMVMTLGVDTLANSFTILLYVELIARHTQFVSLTFHAFRQYSCTLNYAKSNIRLAANKDDFIEQLARVFAIPASSFVW